MLLLMEAWKRPGCRLPDNDELLAKLASLNIMEWLEIKPVIMAFWTMDGRTKEWRQKRLSKERTFVELKCKQNRDAAVTRWKRDKKDNANAMPESCERNAPTPTPTPTLSLELPSKVSKIDRMESLTESVHLKRSNGNGCDKSFDEFWIAYPRKQGKAKAHASYRSSLSRATHSEIMAGVQRYVSWIDRNSEPPQFVKMPTTWLNQGCWEDELKDRVERKEKSTEDKMREMLSKRYERKYGNGKERSDPKETNGVLLRIADIRKEIGGS